MGIPRTIHTCWFGGAPKSPRIEACLASHRAKLPGYRFVEWTEDSVDLDEFPFLREAWRRGRYAHLSDMVRLLVLQRHGGIYLDTDVEVVRPLDPLLGAEFLAGYMWDCMLGTAVVGAEAGHPLLAALLEPYMERWRDIRLDLPNNHLMTRHFMDHVPGFRLDGREWRSGGIHILDRYGFEQPSLGRRRNYAIHHFSASWKGEAPLKRAAKAAAIRVFGLYLYRRVVCARSLARSPFRPAYEAARRASRAGRPVAER